MTQKDLRRPSLLLIALVALGFVLAGCGGDDDGSTSDGAAPTTEQDSDEGSDGEGSEEEGSEEGATDAGSAAYAQAIEQQAAALGVSSVRVDGDGTNVLVMADGSTSDQIGPACDYAETILPEGTAISTDLAGEVAPCP